MRVLIAKPVGAGGVGYYYEKIKPHFKCNVKYLPVGKRKDNETKLQAIFRLISDYLSFSREVFFGRFDLIHINPSLLSRSIVRDGILLLIAKLFRKKTIVFFRGWDVEFEKVIRTKYLKLFRFTYFSADAIIVLASGFKKSLIEMGFDKPIYVETTLVSDETFNGHSNHSENHKNPGDINILFLSRIERNKGIYESIDAFRNLKRSYPDIRMNLAGDGSELDSVRKYIASANIPGIEILGWIDNGEKDRAYRNADIYLFPTRHGEGMPNSLLEAMAYGLPVITCPAGGIKDFFESGEMGFLTESIESGVIAGHLESLICDPLLRKKIGDYNYNYARHRFKASLVAQRLCNIYTHTLNPELSDSVVVK